MKKIKLVIVCSSFSVGGAENMVAQLIANIRKDEFEVYPILTNARCDNQIQALVDNAKIECVYLSKVTKKNNIERIKIFFHMWKYLRDIRPDVIHTNLSCVFYCIPYVLFHRAKLLHTVHNIPEKDLSSSLIFMLKILIMLGKARLISISGKIQSKICDRYKITPDMAPIIYNPVDRKKFISICRKKDDGCVVFTNIGRLTAQKNQLLLLKAFSIAIKKNNNIRLQIVGEGELREELYKQSVVLGIDKYVKFMGSRADIPEILYNSDVFILSSIYEGLPLTILEAMAARLPVISTDVGGISDIVHDNMNGILTKNESINDLVEAILLLASNHELRKKMGENSYKFSKNYDVSIFVEKYMLQYKKLTEELTIR